MRSQVPAAVLLLALAAGDTRSETLRAAAGDQQKSRNSRKQRAQEYALLFGSVFDEAGRAVRGANVRVRQKDGKKKWEASTNPRGEFAVRLPVGAGVYIAQVSLSGFTGESKEVSFAADERQDISLRLSKGQ